jgi:hypothetical protein
VKVSVQDFMQLGGRADFYVFLFDFTMDPAASVHQIFVQISENV